MIFWPIALLSLAVWIYLFFFRGLFWLNRECENTNHPKMDLSTWPSVVAIIPSRNEEKTLPVSLPALLEQDYKGFLSIIVVDDESEDATFAVAQNISKNAKRFVSVLSGKTLLSSKWTGKVWALHQGVVEAEKLQIPCTYYLFTDADIVYGKASLTNLILEALNKETLLTSFMVKLHCQSSAEKFLIPAFVYFFNMIYPFSWVNRKDTKISAAAGGCLLVDKLTLERAGGLSTIQASLIDDCALAKNIKPYGPIWLGFANTIQSIREYSNWHEIRYMVSRTAFAQLNNSYLLLLGTILGMVITFLSPPFVMFFGTYPLNLLGCLTWLIMTITFIPTIRYYKCSLLLSMSLPLIAATYMVFTLDSALQNFLGKGGFWKGRVQAFKNNDDGSKRP